MSHHSSLCILGHPSENGLSPAVNFLAHAVALHYETNIVQEQVFGDSKKIGKPTRGDKKKGKATIIKNLGVNKAIEFSYQLADGITEKLKNRYGT